MSRRVLIITYYWPPCGGSGVQRWVKFAKYHPYADENQLSFVNSRMFVEQTKKVEVEETEKEVSEAESTGEEQNQSTMAEK